MKKISVDLEDEIVDKISEIAIKNYRSFSDQVRKILDEYREEVKSNE